LHTLRAGALDSFGEPRTRQFWSAQYLLRTFGGSGHTGQSWLIPPADPASLLQIPVVDPTRQERLQSESDLFGFAISGHSLSHLLSLAGPPSRILNLHRMNTVGFLFFNLAN
jgi:DNA polymerase III alpha subunit